MYMGDPGRQRRDPFPFSEMDRRFGRMTQLPVTVRLALVVGIGGLWREGRLWNSGVALLGGAQRRSG